MISESVPPPGFFTIENYLRFSSTSIPAADLNDLIALWQVALRLDPKIQEAVAKSIGVDSATIHRIARECPSTIGVVPKATPFIVNGSLFADRLCFIYDGGVRIRNPLKDSDWTVRFGMPRRPWRALPLDTTNPPAVLHICEDEPGAIKLIAQGRENDGSRVIALPGPDGFQPHFTPYLAGPQVLMWMKDPATETSAKFAQSILRALHGKGPEPQIRVCEQ